jgi:hypothetical protein
LHLPVIAQVIEVSLTATSHPYAVKPFAMEKRLEESKNLNSQQRARKRYITINEFFSLTGIICQRINRHHALAGSTLPKRTPNRPPPHIPLKSTNHSLMAYPFRVNPC